MSNEAKRESIVRYFQDYGQDVKPKLMIEQWEYFLAAECARMLIEENKQLREQITLLKRHPTHTPEVSP